MGVQGRWAQLAEKRAADLKRRADGLTLRFSSQAAADAIGFFHNCLIFDKGIKAGEPFVLLPWQRFITEQVYGWERYDDDLQRWVRLYSRVYICTGKGSGKSPWAAACAAKGLLMDGEARPEIYIAARTAEQCLPLFRYVTGFIRGSALLLDHCQIVGGNNPYRILLRSPTDPEQGIGFIQRLASDKLGQGKSGPSPSMVIIDEYHEAESDRMLEFLSAGTKDRTQPMTIILTNAGSKDNSACYREDQLARRILAGEIERPEYFAFIAALDDDDDPFADETCWEKANPSMPDTPTRQYLREQITASQHNPSKRALVDRLNFCRWTDATAPWLTEEAYRGVEAETLDVPADAEGYLGIDLSLVADLTAAAVVWRSGDRYWLDVHSFIPSDTVETRTVDEDAPYPAWIEQGYITATPGSTVNYGAVVNWIADILKGPRPLKVLAYDPWRIDMLCQAMDIIGLPYTRTWPALPGQLFLAEHGQGVWRGSAKAGDDTKRKRIVFWMPRSIDLFEKAILDKSITIKTNPVLRWASFSAHLYADQQGNRSLRKGDEHSGRIDPLVASVMALGAACEYGRQAAEMGGNAVADQWDQILGEPESTALFQGV